MDILVTGASGFVGAYLVRKLKRQDHEVTCLVRKTSNISELTQAGVKFAYGDILNETSLNEAVANKDVIYHLVGRGSLSANSEKDFQEFYNVNVGGTKNLLNAIHNNNPHIKKIIYTSSTAAVGLLKGVVNETTVSNAQSPYQRSKRASEELVLSYHKEHGLPVTIIRPSMVYGPRGVHSEILRMCHFIKKGFFPLFNDGNNFVPLVHVEDLVDGLVLASEKGRNGSIYFILNDETTTMNQLIDAISLAMGITPFKVHIPKGFAKTCAFLLENLASALKFRPIITSERIDSMTENRVFSVEKAKKELGFEQRIRMADGIRKTVEWYRENNYI
jgi:nucleoside-diphosphate-sugar epimerase